MIPLAGERKTRLLFYQREGHVCMVMHMQVELYMGEQLDLMASVIGIGLLISVIDARSYRIPDFLVFLTGCVSVLFTWTEGWGLLRFRIFAALTGGLVLLFLHLRKGLGLGDVKYGTVLSYAVGLYGTWIMLAVASLTGMVWYFMRGRSPLQKIPFAPFLTLGALVTFLWKGMEGGGS